MATEQRTWALRFGELGLKSAPVRRNFEGVLRASLETVAINEGIDLFIERSQNMVLASSHGEPELVEGILRRCFGLVGADPVTPMALEPEVVATAALQRDQRRGDKRTFAVRCRRSGAKQGWGSQQFAGDVGFHMLQGDPSLKVDLSNPQITVRVQMSAKQAWLMGDRIPGPGGLPCGVQGDVIARVVDEDDLLTAWQVMRRGAGLVPVEGCEQRLMDLLDKWHPRLLKADNGKTSDDKHRRRKKRRPWGFIGMSREEACSIIGEVDGRETPAVDLNATQGWSETEKMALLAHITEPAEQPWGHAGNPAQLSWIT